MITVEHLQKNFKKTIKQPGIGGAIKSLVSPQFETFEAVKDLSFHVPEGEIMGFIGPNGAGKSTTIKMLTGILSPTSGFCEINNQIPQKDRKNYVKNIGVVFGQRTQLWWDLPLRETYGVLKEIYAISNDSYKKRLDFLNEVLSLDEFIGDPVRTLSLGQRMRADIAASLLHSPKVLFLDEPTIGLDVAVKENIRKAILKINQEENTTVILTTHDLNDIELLCDRVYMIDEGREVFDGSIDDLKRKFGKIHEIDFELLSGEEKKDIKYPKFCRSVDIQKKGNLMSVHYDSGEISTPEILKLTLSQVQAKDVRVKDTDIEEIVKKFFRKEVTSYE